MESSFSGDSVMNLDRARHCRRFSLIAAVTLATIGAPVYGATSKTGQDESNIFVMPGLNNDSSTTLRREETRPASAFCRPQAGEEDVRVAKLERTLALMQTAFACVRDGKPLQALAVFSEIIGQDPRNDQAFLNRGTLYVKLGLLDEGIEACYPAQSRRKRGLVQPRCCLFSE